ncbi:hypothetical protein K456DRAFT_780658 [Colletotrichum gloeosporioides 23]|nr:hypothetical protein K456DRAFT_780658 [Colletotrichum gloeosporioides 23]
MGLMLTDFGSMRFSVSGQLYGGRLCGRGRRSLKACDVVGDRGIFALQRHCGFRCTVGHIFPSPRRILPPLASIHRFLLRLRHGPCALKLSGPTFGRPRVDSL